MDREAEIIKSISDIVKIISGIQDNIKSLTDSMFLMKERIEKLEAL